LSWRSDVGEVRERIEELRVAKNQTWAMALDTSPFAAVEKFPVLCDTDTIEYEGDGGQLVDYVYKMLKECDNIRHLKMDLSQGGCVIDTDIRSFDWQRGDKICDLETLSLSGYRWGAPAKRPWCDDSCNCRESTEPWSKAMDWSMLKKLDIDRPPSEFVQLFTGKLTGLKSLSIRPKVGFWGDEDSFCEFDENATELRKNYVDFITSMPSLKELDIRGMGEILNLSKILHTYGRNLERFSVHDLEDDCRYGTGNAT
jgi:hypothetical protein